MFVAGNRNNKYIHIYGMIQFCVTFSPNEAGYFFFRTSIYCFHSQQTNIHVLQMLRKIIISPNKICQKSIFQPISKEYTFSIRKLLTLDSSPHTNTHKTRKGASKYYICRFSQFLDPPPQKKWRWTPLKGKYGILEAQLL